MKINTVEIWTDDLNQQTRFYRDLLELTVVEHPAQEKIETQVGKTRLVLHQGNWTPSGHYHFAFDVPENQFVPALEWLKQRVDPATNANGQTLHHFDKWNADSVYFKDPDGNILELIARHNQPNAASGAFSAQSVLSVSEFGIPSSNVLESVQQLCEKLPAIPYDGAGSDEFTAVGDELGLLIIVRKGRIWMPGTGKAAEFVPFRLMVTNKQGKEHQISAPEYPFEIKAV